MMEDENRMVVVCDNCLMSCCIQGEFMCEEARSAGTTEKPISELGKLKLEDEHYWEKER